MLAAHIINRVPATAKIMAGIFREDLPDRIIKDKSQNNDGHKNERCA